MSGMEFITVLGIAVGLSMDAFTVAITQGACLDIQTMRYPLSISTTFGAFQAVMPLIGFAAGSLFCLMAQQIDHWIALLLLSAVGIKMMYDGVGALREQKAGVDSPVMVCEVKQSGHLSTHTLFVLGIATSIDALAVGITFGLLGVNILVSVIIIGLTTFIISFGGVYLGKKVGPLFGRWMEILGGTMLIFMGINIAVDHISKGI
jgi:putative Mn2+ efflux pump MntP